MSARRWLPPALAHWFAPRPGARGDHFDGREFHNLHGVPTGGRLVDLLRWKLLGERVAPWPEPVPPDAVTPSLASAVEEGGVAVTFIGHSTFLLQFAGGLNVLTDPIWSERASPVSFIGPRRARPPALVFEELPPIDLVLVSHGHYDHLDLPTLRRLEERFRPLFISGLGNGKFLLGEGMRRVEELDWWQSHHHRTSANTECEVIFTPAQHWSVRNPLRRNRTLWGGFWLRGGTGPRVFFGGDSGYGAHFGLIHERLGPPDLALLPLGAYEPRWFMRDQHMNPDDAVLAHLALAARRSVGMHFGTFRLTDEGVNEPAEALAASLQTRGVDPDTFRVPRFGETIHFPAANL